jgi:hypothetical protein
MISILPNQTLNAVGMYLDARAIAFTWPRDSFGPRRDIHRHSMVSQRDRQLSGRAKDFRRRDGAVEKNELGASTP